MTERSHDPERTDPRIARTRRSVIAAVESLLAEDGAEGVTHQRVAERAGVGRATLYRHWPNATDLLYDALAEIDDPVLFRAGEGPLVEWLRRELRRGIREMGQPNAVQFHAVLIGRAPLDPGAAELRQRLVDKNVSALDVALDVAVASGELVDRPAADDLMAEIVGPLFFRVVVEGRRVSDSFIDRVIARAVDPWVAAADE